MINYSILIDLMTITCGIFAMLFAVWILFFKDHNKENKEKGIFDEENCKCGTQIPKGYGYYNYGNVYRCRVCGRVNLKNKRRKNQNEKMP